jgi:hypothetical protein
VKRERSDGGSSVSKKKKAEPKADLVRPAIPRYRMRSTLNTLSARDAVRTPVVPRLWPCDRRKMALGLAAAHFLLSVLAAVELRVSSLGSTLIMGAHHDSIAACGQHRCGGFVAGVSRPPLLFRRTTNMPEHSFLTSFERSNAPPSHTVPSTDAAGRNHASPQNEVFYKNKEESVAGKLPRYVELLKFKTLSVGMKLWGAVAEVSARDLVISLPHGLKGFVAPAEASDALAAQLAELDSDDSDLSDDEDTPAKPGKRKPATSTAASLADTFRVGQLVCCVVTALAKEAGGKKAARIELSLRLSKLHAGMALNHLQPGTHVPAVVSSVEDHGLIVSFGIAGVSGASFPFPARLRSERGGVESARMRGWL